MNEVFVSTSILIQRRLLIKWWGVDDEDDDFNFHPPSIFVDYSPLHGQFLTNHLMYCLSDRFLPNARPMTEMVLTRRMDGGGFAT